MSLMDFLFPEQSQAVQMRKIAEAMKMSKVAPPRSRANDEALAMREDLDLLTLMLLSMFRSMVEKGVISKEDLLRHISEVDALDGAKDGTLSADALREYFGLGRKSNVRLPRRPSI